MLKGFLMRFFLLLEQKSEVPVSLWLSIKNLQTTNLVANKLTVISSEQKS